MTTLSGMEAQQLAGSDVSENTARFVDQGGVEGIRDVSAGRPIRLFVDADDPRRGRQGRHREAAARYGLGVFEIALPFKGDAFRVVYSAQFAEEIWVVHAFQKKSTQGVKTPKREVDLIRDRLKS